MSTLFLNFKSYLILRGKPLYPPKYLWIPFDYSSIVDWSEQPFTRRASNQQLLWGWLCCSLPNGNWGCLCWRGSPFKPSANSTQNWTHCSITSPNRSTGSCIFPSFIRNFCGCLLGSLCSVLSQKRGVRPLLTSLCNCEVFLSLARNWSEC